MRGGEVAEFRDREEAGRLLADKLAAYKDTPSVICALPRGGVVLGVEVAKALQAPLDLIIPRKIGHPEAPEYAVCAVTEDGHLICSQQELDMLDPTWLKHAVLEQQAEAKRRRQTYLRNRTPVVLAERTAIVVDDGVATGLTMQAAIHAIRDRRPAKIVLAAPVIPRDVAAELRSRVDEIVALDEPAHFLGSIGAYYQHFEPVKDEEVIKLLQQTDAKLGAKKG